MRLTLTEAREKRRWTPEELAAQSGVGRSTVYRLEAGGFDPRWTTVEALEKALGLKPGTLVFDVELAQA